MRPFGNITSAAAGFALVWALAAASTQVSAQDHVTIGLLLEPPHLDPTATAAEATDQVTYANIFEGLTRIDETGAVRPALAHSWDVSADGRTYIFELREGVTFHDGTAFDAGDVKFSLDRARAEGSTNAQRWLFSSISNVEVIDPLTIRIHLERVTADFLTFLGWGDANIVAPETAATNRTAPVGTGPFRFVRWKRGDSIVLARYDGYWGAPPRLAGSTFKFISDPAAAFAALMAGDVDAFPNYSAPETLFLFEEHPKFSVVVGSTQGEVILAMNNTRPPFDDLRVRRALAHAVDRKELIEGAMFGYGTPIGSHFSPLHPAYIDLTDRYPHDPARARALLAEAGFPNGLSVRLKLPPPLYARRSGEIVAAQLRRIGIESEIESIEWAQWMEQVYGRRDYDLSIIAHTEPMDYDIYAREGYYFGYANPQVRALVTEIRRTREESARRRLLRRAQRTIAEDSVNAFLFQLPKLGVWDARLKGLWRDAPVQATDLTRVRFE